MCEQKISHYALMWFSALEAICELKDKELMRVCGSSPLIDDGNKKQEIFLSAMTLIIIY